MIFTNCTFAWTTVGEEPLLAAMYANEPDVLRWRALVWEESRDSGEVAKHLMAVHPDLSYGDICDAIRDSLENPG